MFSRKALRIKAMQHLFAFFVQQKAIDKTIMEVEKREEEHKKNADRLQGGLEQEVARIGHVAFNLINLLVVWARMDGLSTEGGVADAYHSLEDNRVIKWLQSHAGVDVCKPLYIWSEELAKLWYDECLQKHPMFLAYTSKKEHTLEDDREFVVGMVKKVLLRHRYIQKHITLEGVGWRDNKLIVQRLLLSAIAMCTSAEEGVAKPYSLGLSLQDKSFYDTLVSKTVQDATLYEACVDKRLKNWDATRVAFLDGLLLKMALTEARYGEATPKAVIISEYIHLAQQYSTPKSHIFIHGMLEGLIDELGTDTDGG